MNDDEVVHVLDFDGCNWMVQFLERCGVCDRKECKYRKMLMSVLSGEKRIEYGNRLSDKGKWNMCVAKDDCPFCGNKLDSGHMSVICKKCGFKLDY
jgi:hypothetical protein